MTITLHRPAAMTDRHWSAWAEIHSANPAFASPYFHPEFTRAVASVRDDVEVGVIEDRGEPIGFFPFQRDGRMGRPVGGRLSDFHGVVLKGGRTVDLAELMTACRLRSWHFDHLVTPQQPFQQLHWTVDPSPYVQLSGGYEAWRAAKHSEGTDLFSQTERKARKCCREVGELRFEWHTDRDDVFEMLTRLKSEQYRATGLTDVFSFPWTVALIDRLRKTTVEGFSGIMSALFVGDRPAAVHFGMRAGNVLHSWFPAYDRELSRFSLGQCLFLRIAQACQEHGVTRIDLGKGNEPYKVAVMTAAEFVAEGVADHRPLSRAARRAWHETRHWLRSHEWIRTATETPLRLLRPLRERRAFQ